MAYANPTPIEGVHYFEPPEGYCLTGRDGLVDMPWGDLPIPLSEADYRLALEAGAPGYDQVGNGIFQALRRNPECANAELYADILQKATHTSLPISAAKRSCWMPGRLSSPIWTAR